MTLAPLYWAFACSLSLCAFGQHARTAPAPQHEGEAFSAPQLLTDLTEGAMNRGVTLTGDLDSDGDIDLLALEYATESSIGPRALQTWLNVGQSHYVHTRTLSLSTPATLFRLADITGDGVLDFIYVVEPNVPTHFRVHVHPGLGDGQFGADLQIIGYGARINGLVVGDCDGDDDLDLLVGDDKNSLDSRESLAWWRYEGGVFVSGSPLVLDVAGFGLFEGLDIEGDGIMDAVGLKFSDNLIQVVRTVNGVPTLDATISLPSEIIGNQRQRTGDLDGDGDDDVLIVQEDFPEYVFHFQPVLNSGGAFQLAPLQTVPNSVSNSFVLRKDGEIVDWDEDGDLDYVSPTLAWMENVGGASFVEAGSVDWGTAGTNQISVHVTDLDGDGHVDALARWTFFPGNRTFPRRNSTNEPGLPPGSSTPSRLEDWEGDGDLDFVQRDKLYLNNGDGSFAGRGTPLPHIPGVSGLRSAIGWGDFDGDGFRDVVVACFEDLGEFIKMALCTGTDDGTYQVSPTVPSSIQMTAPNRSLSGDLDGDGDQDILTQDGFWQNDGSGQFGTALVPAYVGTPIRVIDLERDGDLDLLVDDGAVGTSLRWLRNLGGLSFQETLLGASGTEASFLDADEDGDLDLAVTYPDENVVRIFAQLPSGDLAAPLVLSQPGADGAVGQIDVDGDGRLELLCGGTFDGFGYVAVGTLSAWTRGPGLTFSERRDYVTSFTPSDFGDIDRDGDIEPVGTGILENLAADGSAVQYGLDAATSGTGGIHPVLGSGAQARPGRFAKFVIGRGRGGAYGVLLAGDARADVLDGGIRRLVDSPIVPRTFTLDGTPGAAGQGSLVLEVPVIPALVGRTRDFQVVLVDPGSPSGFSATNGLEVRFGD